MRHLVLRSDAALFQLSEGSLETLEALRVVGADFLGNEQFGNGEVQKDSGLSTLHDRIEQDGLEVAFAEFYTCLYPILLVEVEHCLFDLFEQSFKQLHLFGWTWDSDCLQQHLSDSTVGRIHSRPTFVVHVQGLLVEPVGQAGREVVDAELLHPSQVDRYSLGGVRVGAFDGEEDSATDVVVVEEQSSHKRRQSSLIEYLLPDYLPLFQTVKQHQHIPHKLAKRKILFLETQQGLPRGSYFIRVADFEVAAEQLHAHAEGVLPVLVVAGYCLNYLRRDVGTSHLRLHGLGVCPLLSDQVHVLEQQPGPGALLAPTPAECLQVGLPPGDSAAHEGAAPETAIKHIRLYDQSGKQLQQLVAGKCMAEGQLELCHASPLFNRLQEQLGSPVGHHPLALENQLLIATQEERLVDGLEVTVDQLCLGEILCEAHSGLGGCLSLWDGAQTQLLYQRCVVWLPVLLVVVDLQGVGELGLVVEAHHHQLPPHHHDVEG